MDDAMIRKIREFNRSYTVWLEVLNREYLGTGFSWAQSRVLFEIYRCPGINATELCAHLNMDKSYVSRILLTLEKRGLLTRSLVPGTKGLKEIRLTEAGEKAAAQIDANGNRQIADKLKEVDEDDCVKLCEAMELIQNVLREHDEGGIRK